ncbi:MAG: ribosome biogenesis GTPase Der [Rickettsiales bacterium]|nr:ribosome biogenesis GTPase Der [Rickettsiales bacterium]
MRLAIIGRPNVGKSTLYNRLVGRKEAIVFDTPGVTRDRRYGKGNVGPLDVEIIDTPGLEEATAGSLAERMSQQALKALEEADVVLLVIDAIVGITSVDETFARQVRQRGLPVVLIANKAESKQASNGIADAWRLGFGEPVAFSAEHGEGMADLYDALAPYAGEAAKPEERGARRRRIKKVDAALAEEEALANGLPDETIKLTILGRPNVGKSTLINKLLGEERLLTGPEAGMTRDAVTIPFSWRGQALELVDTAGLRKKGKVEGVLEKMSIGNTTNALRYTHVAILVLDATMPLEKQDNALAGLIEREGRACVIAVNKWDLVEDKKALLEDLQYRLEDVIPQMKSVPLVPVSAARGEGLDRLIKDALHMYRLWNTRLGTGELNRWLQEATDRHNPPMISGRRFKLRYITQSKTRPPRFVIFANRDTDIPTSYERYLVNHLRESFNLPGIPIRMLWRAGKNPYV